jgi:hypothetical protein
MELVGATPGRSPKAIGPQLRGFPASLGASNARRKRCQVLDDGHP